MYLYKCIYTHIVDSLQIQIVSLYLSKVVVFLVLLHSNRIKTKNIKEVYQRKGNKTLHWCICQSSRYFFEIAKSMQTFMVSAFLIENNKFKVHTRGSYL